MLDENMNLTNLQFYVNCVILYIATENFYFKSCLMASGKCDIMIGAMPIVTAFNQKRMCFSVDIYETINGEEGKIGKASVILGKTDDEPEIKFYQVQTTHTYLSSDLSGSCFMKDDKTYIAVAEACIYASMAIWG